MSVVIAELRGGRVESRAAGAWVRQHPPSPKDIAEVRRLVRELGGDSFADREQAQATLREIGLIALPVLKDNVKNSDLEIAKRVKILLAGLARVDQLNSVARLALPRAAIRLLVRRRSEGAVHPGADKAGGKLTITGNYIQYLTGSLAIDVLSGAANGFGVLDAKADVTLAGTSPRISASPSGTAR